MQRQTIESATLNTLAELLRFASTARKPDHDDAAPP
jgi:hypothetical protein